MVTGISNIRPYRARTYQTYPRGILRNSRHVRFDLTPEQMEVYPVWGVSIGPTPERALSNEYDQVFRKAYQDDYTDTIRDDYVEISMTPSPKEATRPATRTPVDSDSLPRSPSLQEFQIHATSLLAQKQMLGSSPRPKGKLKSMVLEPD